MKKSIFIGYFCPYFGRLVYYNQNEFFVCVICSQRKFINPTWTEFFEKGR